VGQPELTHWRVSDVHRESDGPEYQVVVYPGKEIHDLENGSSAPGI
jgi:hypothetical protein